MADSQLSKHDLEVMAHRIVDNAWGFRHGPDGVMPTWFIDGKRGLLVVGTPFEEDVPNAKQIAAREVSRLVRKNRPVDYVMFVSDAWVRIVAPDAPVAEFEKQVSRQLDAVECITVQCWTHSGEDEFSLIRAYRQQDDGTLVILKDTRADGGSVTSTFRPVVRALRKVVT